MRRRRRRRRGKALAEERGEKRVGAVSNEPLSGINHKLREPSIVVVPVDGRVSEGVRGTIVRRRLGPAEGAFAELASGSTFVRVVLLLLFFRRHHNNAREREKEREREREEQ